MPKTLCEWTRKDIEQKLPRLREIIGHPTHVCRKCARSAAMPEHLCKPMPLPASTKQPQP